MEITVSNRTSGIMMKWKERSEGKQLLFKVVWSFMFYNCFAVTNLHVNKIEIVNVFKTEIKVLLSVYLFLMGKYWNVRKFGGHCKNSSFLKIAFV